MLLYIGEVKTVVDGDFWPSFCLVAAETHETACRLLQEQAKGIPWQLHPYQSEALSESLTEGCHRIPLSLLGSQ
jgi:hypothetical protein